MNLVLSLPDDLARFVDAQVEAGGYSSSSDVVVAALNLLKQQEQAAKLKWLQDAWQAGIKSGDAGPLDFDELKAEARHRLARRI